MDEYRIESHKLIYHPERVAQWLKSCDNWEMAKKTYPLYLEISPTGTCNHHCTFCAMDFLEYRNLKLDLAIMERVIPEIGNLGIKSIMFAGEGEPFLYRRIAELGDLAVKSGIDIAFTTNAVNFTPTTATKILPITRWIKASIDAGTPETYKKLHQTHSKDFETVLANLKHAVNWRNKQKVACTIGAQMLLLPDNASEIHRLAKICRDVIGLDYLVIKSYSQHPSSCNRHYNNLDYARIEQMIGDATKLSDSQFKVIARNGSIQKQKQRRFGFSNCHAVPFFWAYIRSNLDVYACSTFLKDRRFLLGNLAESTFEDIWQGEAREKLFQTMKGQFNLTQCRLNCRMSAVNEYLEELANPGPHVNFI